MDQETAQKALREGAILICTNVPEGTHFSIDCHAWVVGPNFRGVKMIPPGPHFISYSATSKGESGSEQVGTKSGFFLYLRKQQIVAKVWSKDTEELLDTPLTEDDKERLRASLPDMDRFLGAYQFDNELKKWLSLSNYISEEVLQRLNPTCGVISSISPQQPSQAPSTTTARTTVDSMNTEIDSAAQLSQAQAQAQTQAQAQAHSEDYIIKFSSIQKHILPENVTAAELSKHSLDLTYKLNTLIASNYPNDGYKGLLGELQYAFICFLYGQVFDAFEQWKILVHLICNCNETLIQHPDLFREFMGVLHFQLKETPQDFFIDIVTRNNFLLHSLHSFFANIQETEGVKPELKTRALKFKALLSNHYQWDFDQDIEEDMPVVVDMPEE